MANLQYASIPFEGLVLPTNMQAPVTPLSWRIADLSGGLRPLSTLAGRDEGASTQWYNEGLLALPGGILTLPYKSTAQTALAAVDVTATRTGNGRVHGLMWPTSSGGRFIATLGPNLYKDTSVSDPALTAPATADNITDDVLAMWTGVINGSYAMIIGTDSTTDDIKFTTDPTADTITWAAGVTYANANDRCYWGAYLADLGQHVVGGVLNNIPRVYSFKGATATPLTSTTVRPVVFAAGSDVPNPDATLLNTGQVSPTSAYTGTVSGITRVITEATGEWATPTNAIGSDDSRATASIPGSGGLITHMLFLSGFNLAELVPAAALDIRLKVEIERSEGDAAHNITDAVITVGSNLSVSATDYAGGVNDGITGYTFSPTGGNKATTTEYPVAASEAVATYGGEADRWGGDLTAALVRSADFCVAIMAAGAASGVVNVDDLLVTVYYTLPGTEVSSTTLGAGAGILATGGYTCRDGPDPVNPSRVSISSPESNDPTGLNVRRRLLDLTFAYDSDNDRLTLDESRPPIGEGTLIDFDYFLGGKAVVVGPSFDESIEVKVVTEDYEVHSAGFPQIHGSTAVRAGPLFARGLALFQWVFHNDSTDCQLWMFFDGRWLPYGALFSKTLGGAMSTKPIPWAEKSFGEHQQQIYCFYPSSTNTAVIRQFVPSNPFSDPNLTNTSQVKQDGPLYVQLPETAVFPPEDRNAVLALQSQSRRIDDNTAYGSLRVLMDTGGDTAIASAEVDQTFDATAETFTDRNLASSSNPGVAFKTLIVRLIGNHQASSAETPNLLPLVIHTVSQPPFLPEIEVRIKKSVYQPKALYDALSTAQASKTVNRFSGGGFNDPFVVTSVKARWKPDIGTMQPSWSDLEGDMVVTLRQVRGGLS